MMNSWKHNTPTPEIDQQLQESREITREMHIIPPCLTQGANMVMSVYLRLAAWLFITCSYSFDWRYVKTHHNLETELPDTFDSLKSLSAVDTQIIRVFLC